MCNVLSSFEKEACFVLFHLDLEDPSSWIFIRFVSERAQVKKKMMYSSASSSLKMSLGSTSFPWSIFIVDKESLDLNAFVEENLYKLTPGAKELLSSIVQSIQSSRPHEPATGDDVHVPASVYASESLTRAEQQALEESRQEKHTGGPSSLAFPVDPALPESLQKFKDGSVNFLELVCYKRDNERKKEKER